MTTKKKIPARVTKLMRGIESERERRVASAVRHIRATTRGTPSGVGRERISLAATGKVSYLAGFRGWDE